MDRSFTIKGSGTVVTGTLTGGTLQVEDTVAVLPGGSVARVRTLHTHQRSITTAVPGSRVAANLVGVDPGQVPRGTAIVGGGDGSVTHSFAVRVVAASGLDAPITERGSFELHVGSAESRCRLRLLDRPLLGSSEKAIAHLVTANDLPLVCGDRFVIRDLGRQRVVAGGVVLDPAPGKLKRMDAAALQRLGRREGRSPADLARLVLADRGASTVSGIATNVGMSRTAVADLARSWTGVRAVGAVLAEETFLAEQRERVLRFVADHHASYPLEPGIARDQLLARLDTPAASELLASWIDDGTLVAHGNTLKLHGFATTLDATERAQADQLLRRLRSGRHSPPLLTHLDVPQALIRAMERTGELVFVSPDLAYPHDVWDGIERRIVTLIGEHGACTVAQARDAIGTTRRYAVPILEKLDSIKITRRQGDDRFLGPRGRALLAGQPDAT